MYTSYVIPAGFKIVGVDIFASDPFGFKVKLGNVATSTGTDLLTSPGTISTSAPADTFAGYSASCTPLDIQPSASLGGGLGNYINIMVTGSALINGGTILLEKL